MRIVCLECGAAYEVPEALIGSAPRRLRCAKCSEEWTIDPPVPPAPPPPAAIEEPVAAAFAPEPTTPTPGPTRVQELRVPELRAPESPYEGMRRTEEKRAGGVVVLAWVLSLVLLAAIGAAAFVWRASIMAAWPPSERVYAALGLAPR